MDKQKFNVIQCKDYIYITGENTRSGYSSSNIEYLLFDGEKAEKTYKSNWFKLKQIPTLVQKKLPSIQTNVRFELKSGYIPNDLMPKVINLSTLYDSEYEEVSGLYERKYDTEEAGYEDIPFETEVIYKKDDFEWIKAKYNSIPSLLSQIEFHPDILQEFPQVVSSEDMYSIIRNYVKANINNLVAKITSDYDFHFEVKRKILIAEPYTRNVDLNSGNKRKKPNWVTHNINTKEVTILNIKRKSNDTSYGENCMLAPTIRGDSYVDLENKILEYLESLMREVNKQFEECPHCKGWGVIEVSENNG